MMKHITTGLILLLISFSVMGQKKGKKVKWYSIEEAMELSKKEPRKIFIDVYTTWCYWCKVMDNQTFSNDKIAKILNTEYYPVKFNAEQTGAVEFRGQTFINDGEGRKATHQLAVALLQGKLSYPSIVYLDEEGNILTSVPGFMKPVEIEPVLKFFSTEAYKKEKWESYKAKFKGTI